MDWLNRLRRRARAIAHREEIDREMDEEMRFHLEMEAEELVRSRGLTPEDARRRARLANEALTGRRVVGEVGGEDLDGDVAVELHVAREVHDAHAAAPQLALE